MDWHEEEQESYQRGGKIIGVDEAGRGPLAGPVVAAAVILPSEFPVEILNDSKKLSAKKREAAFEIILQSAVSYGIVEVDSQTIDQINILQATLKAMYESVRKISVSYKRVIVDGRRAKELPGDWDFAVGGDRLYASIAAASILAKVHRDRLMERWDAEYPNYQFARNKGYGSQAHMEAIRIYGPCPIHRRSFDPLRSWIEEGWAYE